MKCTIYIDAPDKILKGAGFPVSQFIPSHIFKIKFIIKNTSPDKELCSFSGVLGNGIRYLGNIEHQGPDANLLEVVNITNPSKSLSNNNVIIFGNNFNLSPNSTNIIQFDGALYDKYTLDSIENSGETIGHKSIINFYGHLINGEEINSSFVTSQAMDVDMDISCHDEDLSIGDISKYYIDICTSQYNLAKNVYLRSVLDEGVEYIGDSCNLEPDKVYASNGNTIIKWDLGSLQPSERRKIGFKIKIKDPDKKSLINKFNSNSINNSNYSQCPVSGEHTITLK